MNKTFRIVTYNDSTRPVIQLYEKENLVKRIDGANDVDKVNDRSRFVDLHSSRSGLSRCSIGFQWFQISLINSLAFLSSFALE
jgi:hypothetical protein